MGKLIHRRDINQVDYGHMSLNCIRYISQSLSANKYSIDSLFFIDGFRCQVKELYLQQILDC